MKLNFLNPDIDDFLINLNNEILKIEQQFNKSGKNASVFNIIGDDKNIIKISKNTDSLSELIQELKIGKIFNENDISTPKYIGIKKVNLNGKIYFGLVMEAIKNGILIKDNIPIGGEGKTIKNTNSEEYKRGKELLEIEIEKIKKLGLKISPRTEKYGFDFQGIYSKKEDKIYLIDFGEIILEKSSKNNKINNLQNFFADYVKNTLNFNINNQEKLYKLYLENELYEGYLENTLEYKSILDKKSNRNLDLLLVEKLIMGKSKKEFTEFLNLNSKIVSLLKNGNDEIFRNILNIFKIKTENDLINLLENQNIVDLILNGDLYNFNKIYQSDKISNNDFIELINKPEVIYFIKYGVEGIVFWITQFEDFSKNSLIKLANNKLTTLLFLKGNKYIFRKIRRWLNINSSEQLISLLEDNKELLNIIIYGDFNFFRKKLEILNIEEAPNLDKLIEFREYIYSSKKFENDFNDFKKNSKNKEFLLENFLGYFSQKAIQGQNLELVSENTRKNNIEIVNKNQKEKLEKINFENKNFYLDKDEKNRDLVLYYRGAMNRFEFLLIAKVLSDYVGKYSKVFNRIKVVPRLEEGWDMNKVPEQTYELGDFEEVKYFLKETNIYANTINFVHGTVYETDFSKTTNHIASSYIEEERLSGEGLEEILKLEYGSSNKGYNVHSGKTLQEIADEILRVVVKLENRMLKKI